MTFARRISIIDSHTAGEPTRLVLDGMPGLGDGPLACRLKRLRTEFDDFRTAVVNEPRGHDVIVGAQLCEPHDPACDFGVIFFNNVGYLGMCGHGTIGVIKTLAYLGRIQPGEHRVDTPVGAVRATLHENGLITVDNVRSYRSASQVTVEVPGYGPVTGDVAWGGNWFFLVEEHTFSLDLKYVDELTAYTWAIRNALTRQGITGDDGQEIDHIELFGPAVHRGAHSRNFVLCPGKAYDRSPCGTGTSAKMACLYADGKLEPGEVWRQEGILGGIFDGRLDVREDGVYPSITGSAYITAQSTLILDPEDPFMLGIQA
uniref:Hydroxyproline-2-epimerase n=1 Tax=Acidobacterium capsulatum TaxID=33075 RepID=A0A7V4XU28_9BACT